MCAEPRDPVEFQSLQFVGKAKIRNIVADLFQYFVLKSASPRAFSGVLERRVIMVAYTSTPLHTVTQHEPDAIPGHTEVV